MKCIDFTDYRLLFQLSDTERRHIEECPKCSNRWRLILIEREIVNKEFNPDDEAYEDPSTLPEGCRKVSAALWSEIENEFKSKRFPVIDWSRFDFKKLEQFLRDLSKIFPTPLPAGAAACVMNYCNEHKSEENFVEGLQKELDSCGCSKEQIDKIVAHVEDILR